MEWAECAKLREAVFDHSRFSWPVDGWAGFNCEPGFTISDLNGGLRWLWNFPGDALLRQPTLASFLELSPDHAGGILSASVMSFILLCVIACLNAK